MLSKHTFLPTKSLFMAAGIAACGLAAVQQSANALNISLDSSGAPPNYVYSVSLETDEEFNVGETIAFSGMSDVTSASAAPGFSIVSSDATSVVFGADLAFPNAFVPGPSIGNFSISSTAPIGTIAWATDASGSGLKTDSIDGPLAVVAPPPPPTSAAVPFEFSPGLGLILSGTLFGALKLRSKFGKKEEISF